MTNNSPGETRKQREALTKQALAANPVIVPDRPS